MMEEWSIREVGAWVGNGLTGRPLAARRGDLRRNSAVTFSGVVASLYMEGCGLLSSGGTVGMGRRKKPRKP